MTIKLGSRVRDTLTGFEGIATGRTTFLFGCVRVCIESPELEKGETIENWFDEQRVETVKKKPVKISAEADPKAPGGPHPNPVRRADAG